MQQHTVGCYCWTVKIRGISHKQTTQICCLCYFVAGVIRSLAGTGDILSVGCDQKHLNCVLPYFGSRCFAVFSWYCVSFDRLVPA